jgi:phage tail-like protein
MDANGLRCWSVADAAGFGLSGTPRGGPARNLMWRADARLVRLDRQQDVPAVAEDQAYARAQALKPSPVADPGGSFAWWDGVAGTLRAAGFGQGATPISLAPDTPPGVPQPTDLAFGSDDILYVARNDGVVMTDRRDRFADARVELAGFRAQRLCPAPGGGVWALDRVDGKIALLTGVPLRRAGYDPPAPDAFYPKEPNPRPPRLRLVNAAQLPAGHEGIAIAGSPGGRVAVLAWVQGAEAEVFTLDRRKLVRRFAFAGLRFPYSLAWLGESSVAVLASDGAKPAVQAFVYEIDQSPPDGTGVRPVGAFHPLLGIWDGGFVNALADVPAYPVAGDRRDTPIALRRLRALSRTTYARSGSVTIGPFDAGSAGTIWHRLQIEASVPDHAGLRIFAHADDTDAVPVAPGGAGTPDWSPHILGSAAALADQADAPRAAWTATPSELPFNPALLVCPPVPGRSGRFTALLQRAGRRVRRLEGRYLWLHLEFVGDSQVTPELAALRIYGARFSYRDRYLPALYGETLAGPDAVAPGAATPPDFLERFLGLFEGPLTELEDKVADAFLLTDPAATPDAALPWLARWIGIAPDPGIGPARLRQELRAAPWTAQLHGTLGGLMAGLELATGGRVVTGGSIDAQQPAPRPGTLALARLPEVATRALVLDVSDVPGGCTVLTGGSVTRGEIVVVEGFRMRRTFATILGADLADASDPLTGAFARSGNSFVGDTLILGDAAQREVAALFAADMPQSAADRAAVDAFFERLAHRVMILVRASDRTVDMVRLARVAAEAAPAHVETTLVPADRPLIVAVASLVGVDTFLTPAPPVPAVRVGRTRVGTGDRVQGQGRLDARADGPVPPLPVAIADGPGTIRSGTGFVLSAARSQAAPGRTIVRNIWTWL